MQIAISNQNFMSFVGYCSHKLDVNSQDVLKFVPVLCTCNNWRRQNNYKFVNTKGANQSLHLQVRVTCILFCFFFVVVVVVVVFFFYYLIRFFISSLDMLYWFQSLLYSILFQCLYLYYYYDLGIMKTCLYNFDPLKLHF